jgi:ribosome-binding factor A
MDSTRQNKIARLLQKELAEVFQRDAFVLYEKALITVTTVRISPDLSVAKVYLSIFVPNNGDKGKVFQMIKENTKDTRHKVAEKIRHQTRITPNFSWFLDDSLDYALRIEDLLK